MVRFIFVAAIVCIFVLLGYLCSQLLFKNLESTVPKNRAFRESPTPADSDGVMFYGGRSIVVVRPIDYPLLSIFTWFRVSPQTGEDKIVIVANRDIECVSGTQSIGYSMFYSMSSRRISIVWRSKKSRCETETIPVTIPPDVWTHIAVVFKPVEEERMDEILENMVYPMEACFYINGKLVSTRTSIRFLAENRQSLTIGGTPKGENAFHGQLYQLMIVTQAYDAHEIGEVYQRQSRTINSIRKKADYTYAFDSQ